MALSIEEAVAEVSANNRAHRERSMAEGVRMSLDTDSKRRAESEELAAEFGITDPEFVERNYSFLKAHSRAASLNRTIPDSYISKESLRDPLSAEYQDTESLAKVEKGVASDLGRAYTRGAAVHNMGAELFNAYTQDIGNPDEIAARYEGYMHRPERGFMEGIPYQTAETVGQMLQSQDLAAKGALAGGAGGFAATGPVGAAAGAKGGYIAGTMYDIFRTEAGHAIRELSEIEGVTPEQATGAGLLVGAINVGPEFGGRALSLLGLPSAFNIPALFSGLSKKSVSELLKTPVGKKAFAEIAASYVGGAASEGLTEALQELTLEVAKSIYSDGEIQWGNLNQAAMMGMQSGLGIGLPAAAIRTGTTVSDIRASRQMQSAWEALGLAAGESSTLANSPKRFQEFIRRVQDRHGTVDTVYMDKDAATELFQDMDMSYMPETARELADPSANGYIAIPLEEFVSQVAPSPQISEIYKDITFDVNEPTPRMAEDVVAEREAILSEMQDLEVSQDLYSTVREELINAGRIPEVADPEAQLMSAMITRMANRQGMDPIQFWQDNQIRIIGEQETPRGIPTRLSGLLNTLREGRGPTQKDVFGSSLVEMLIQRGGIQPDSELVSRDLEKGMKEYGGRKLAREGGVTMGEAVELAEQGGYITQGEFASGEAALLDAIDREMRGDRVYSPVGLDAQSQQLMMDLDDLQRQLEDAGIDINEMDNAQIIEAMGATEYTQEMTAGERIGVLENLAEAEPEAFDAVQSFIGRQEAGEAARIQGNLEEHAGTPWAVSAVKGMVIREAMYQAAEGTSPESLLGLGMWGKKSLLESSMGQAIMRGKEGMELYASAYDFVGGNRKAEQDYSGSYANCDPSRACAKYCYAAKGTSYNGSLMKVEFTEWMAETNPELLADRIANQYEMSAPGQGGLALRTNEKGDLSEAQLDVIQRLNDKGIHIQIFSKRPELLQKADPRNLRMVSLDSTNLDVVEQAEGMNLAVVVDENIPQEWIAEHNDQVAVYLPVKLGKKAMTHDQLKTLFPDVYSEMRSALCPVDSGKLSLPKKNLSYVNIGKGKGKVSGVWTCTSCDKYGTVGCFHGDRQTAARKLDVNRNTKPEEDAVMDEFMAALERLKESGGVDERRYQSILATVRSGEPINEGASVGQTTYGYSQDTGTGADQEAGGVRADDVAAEPVRELFQQEPRSGRIVRGRIRFDEARDSFEIQLTKKANLSTFTHETGHLYLELLRKAALGGGIVDQTLLDDYAAVKAFVGNTDDVFTNEQHEKMARAMEAYLMEGKAPSVELRGVFQKIKGFMLSVYRYLRRLNVELDDDIRAVFDRALATEEAIAEAESTAFGPMPRSDLIDQKVYDDLARLQAAAVQQATDEVEAIVMTDLKRRKQKKYIERREKLKAEVQAEVEAEPLYVAISTFRGTPHESVPDHLRGTRLSSDEIVRLFGGDKNMLKPFAFMYGSTNTVPADVIADTYGFDSGYAMLQAMASAPKKKDVINQRVQAKLDAEFGNTLQDVNLIEEAAAVMHNDKLVNYILATNKALTKKTNNQSLKTAMKGAAVEYISRLTLRQIKPGKYLQAEQRSARLEAEAIASNNLDDAIKYNRDRLLNQYLYREAQEAHLRADKIRKNLNKITPKTLADIRKTDVKNGTHYAQSIEALLSAVDFKRTSYTKLDARRALRQAVRAMEKEGEVPLVDPAYYEDQATNYREMSLEQLEDLNNTVNALRKMGRTAHTVLVEGQRIERQALIDQMAEEVKRPKKREAKVISEDTRLLARVGRHLQSLKSTLGKVEFRALSADGGTPGLWHKVIFQPFVDAQAKSNDMHDVAADKLKEIWETDTPEDARRLNDKVELNGMSVGRRADLYSVVLNMGNKGNHERLFKGFGWEMSDTPRILRELQELLTADDFVRIEKMGQLLDSYYPQLAAASEKVDGIVPPKVEATELYLEKYNMTLSGWYYPVVYRDDVTTPERQSLTSANDVTMVPSPVTGHVNKSMTKERADVPPGGVLDIRMSVLPAHLNDVIHYITHYETIREFDRLRKDQGFRQLYEDVFSNADYNALRDWVQNIASNGDLSKTVRQADRHWTALIRGARFGFSFGAMAWNLGTGFKQTLGLLTSQAELGGSYLALSTFKYLGGAITGAMPTRKNGFYEAAMEMSSELRHINVQMDRDIREYGMGRMRFIPAGKPKTLYQLVADNPYLLIMEFQKRVNAITLLAAKSKAEDMGLSGKDVVQYAESVVRTTQSGGGLKDLAGIQSGSEITKALTPFYTYFSVLYNRLSEAGRKDLIQGFVKGNTAADKMRGAHEFATNYVWLILAPVIIENLMMGDREGDEDLLNDLMWDQLLYPMTAIPLARDIASSMVLGFEPETPMTGALDSVIKGTKGTYDLMTGEGNWTDVRNAMRALTTTTGLPFFAAAKVAEAVQQDDPLSVARGVAFGVPYHDRRNMD